MVGDSRPTGRVDFGLDTIISSDAWSMWRVFTTGDRGNGNICETSDGRAIAAYTSNADKSVSIAFAPNIKGVLDGTGPIDVNNAIKLNDGYGDWQPAVSINLVNGKLRLAIYYHKSDVNHWAGEYWADSNGKGLDFAKVSDIFEDGQAPFPSMGSAGCPSLINELGDGGLVISMPRWAGGAGGNQGLCPYYSSDDGANWTEGARIGWFVAWLVFYASRNFLDLGNNDFMILRTASNSSGNSIYWTNYGAALTGVDWIGANRPYGASWCIVGHKIYMHYSKTGVTPFGDNPFLLWEFVGDSITAEALMTESNYKQVKDLGVDLRPILDGWHFIQSTPNSFIVQGSSGYQISGAGIIIPSIRPKSIVIDRSKGSASQVNIVIDNKDGKYSPDRSSGGVEPRHMAK